ncbi:Rrf2 family transcriptional regulator [Roseomonas sp. SSH11]|uniref:Rrf2 family transcriptional regulator n=1 Tax=Pararoseomonas baculiformis TaxID=2820812 RepID=A0ABS4AJ35_9PROT|nr:Rrf2 family transcriptional regulator [Pararoseomonas baculiformis]MBP0447044.1 Rrf2 family transcriptional regulator [Pararoseomonas baculiformis]
MQPSLRLLRQDRAQTAISVLLDVAFHAGRGSDGPVAGGAEVAERLGAARRGIEPVFQALSRAGLLEGVRGPRGGYRLGRRPRDIRLSEVIAAVADGSDGGSDLIGALQNAVVVPLWAELDAVLRERLEGLTLEDLLRRAQAAGLQRPAAEPLNFVI